MTTPRDNLLPMNATAFEDAQSQTSARLLDSPVDVIRAARKGATAPAKLLAHLAWERSIHHPSEIEETQRQRIDSSFADHLSYGTPAALEQEIFLDTGVAAKVRDFWEVNRGEWPDFYVCIPVGPGHPQPPADLSGVLISALSRKNVRDWPNIRLEGRAEPVVQKVSVGCQMRVRVMPTPVDGKPRLPVRPFIAVGVIVKIRARLEKL